MVGKRETVVVDDAVRWLHVEMLKKIIVMPRMGGIIVKNGDG